MADSTFTDYYEALELSPSASIDAINAVFPALDARYRPDNASTGDAERHRLVTAAHSVLTNPEQRPKYDAYYQRRKPAEGAAAADAADDDDASEAQVIESDRIIRRKFMTVLYKVRRAAGANGLGDYGLEQAVGIPPDQFQFHLWYLMGKRWVKRDEEGSLTITVDGVDKLSGGL